MRCPVCKADNPQGPQCRRCKADLSLLFDLEEQRRQALAEARVSLRRGEWMEAMRQAETADWLRGDDESKQLAALAHLLEGDFAGAWRCYRDWRKVR
ncbi:MAG TPA: hypothetical protein VH643_32090 [Gemmataceae bacterium]|jgi:hypothetical protein